MVRALRLGRMTGPINGMPDRVRFVTPTDGVKFSTGAIKQHNQAERGDGAGTRSRAAREWEGASENRLGPLRLGGGRASWVFPKPRDLLNLYASTGS